MRIAGQASRTPAGPAATGTVAIRAVLRPIEAGTAAGIPRGVLMDAAGITDADLDDPDARVPVAAEVAVWHALASQIADSGFAIRAAATARVRHFGLLGYVVGFSATLRDALLCLQRYGRVLTEAVEFRLEESARHPSLILGHDALGPGQAFAQDYRLAAALQSAREITGIDLTPIEVRFTYPQPPSILAHRQHFRSPLTFGATTSAIVFRAPDLDLPVTRADARLADYLSHYADQVLTSLVRDDTARHAVRAAIWSVLAVGKPTLKRVATAMGVPTRTLQRHLAAEGTSLHQETEQIRKTMAVATLRDGSVSVADVAFLLGYAEPSAFFRSFKRWTGTSPRQFRSTVV